MRLRSNGLTWWLAAALVFGVIGCGPRGEATEASSENEDAATEETETEEAKAAPVEAYELALGPIEATLTFSADLEAELSVPIYAEAARRVTKLLVEEGDSARAGDLLATLEDDEQRSALAKTEGQVEKAQRDWQRQKELFERELIAEEVFTQATHDLEQLQIALDDAKRQLSYTEIRAPFGGTVTGRMINVGDYVTMNQQVFDMVDFDSLVVRVFVPERDLHRVAVGQPVRLASQASSDLVFEGVVDRISPVVDPQTGTVKTTVKVPYRPGLRPGMFLRVEVVTDVKESALLLPKRALVLDDNQAFVFRVLDDETVERLLVAPALETPEWVEVREGLELGDRIVVAGQAGLKPGDSVRVVRGAGAVEPTAAAEARDDLAAADDTEESNDAETEPADE